MFKLSSFKEKNPWVYLALLTFGLLVNVWHFLVEWDFLPR